MTDRAKFGLMTAVACAVIGLCGLIVVDYGLRAWDAVSVALGAAVLGWCAFAAVVAVKFWRS